MIENVTFFYNSPASMGLLWNSIFSYRLSTDIDFMGDFLQFFHTVSPSGITFSPSPASETLFSQLATSIQPRKRGFVVPISFDTTPSIFSFFRHYLPQANLRVFYAPDTPSRDLEVYCAYRLMIGRATYLAQDLVRHLDVEHTVNHSIEYLSKKFAGERLDIFPAFSAQYDIDALWKAFTGGCLTSSENIPFDRSEVLLKMPGTDVLRFIEAINHIYAQPWKRCTLLWTGQHKFLSGGRNVRPLLSPSQRRFLLERQLREERTLPQHFPIIPVIEQELTTLQGQEDTLEAHDDLDWKNALRLAGLLTGDFAQQILAMPCQPEENQRAVSQMCLEALQEVHGKAPSRARRKKPKVSVLTLTYNHASFIEENIKSILMQQTDFEVEHIIVDNGSSDETPIIIKNYASKNASIRPIIIGHCSSQAIQWLFEAARSEYVALCEGDDYFTDPQKLQIQAGFLDSNPSCSLCFHPVEVRYEGNILPPKIFPSSERLPRGRRNSYYLSQLLRANFVQTNSVMYRWAFRQGLPLWFRPELIPGDWYWHLLHAEKGTLGFIDKVMSVYRRHAKAQYYQVDFDPIAHRYNVCFEELALHNELNRHFSGKHKDIFFGYADDVFADTATHAKKIGNLKRLEEIAELYPHFAGHFMQTLKERDGLQKK